MDCGWLLSDINIAMKNYYHVSSKLNNHLLDDGSVILRIGGKLLQNYVDYFKVLDCRSFESFIEEYNRAKTNCPNIDETGRDLAKWMSEAIFEAVRREDFPDRPNRMDGVFLFADINSAYRFNKKNRDGKASIYKTMLPDDVVQSFQMNLFTAVDCCVRACVNRGRLSENCFNQWTDDIQKYWSNNRYSGMDAEYLYLGELKLVKVEVC